MNHSHQTLIEQLAALHLAFIVEHFESLAQQAAKQTKIAQVKRAAAVHVAVEVRADNEESVGIVRRSVDQCLNK